MKRDDISKRVKEIYIMNQYRINERIENDRLYKERRQMKRTSNIRLIDIALIISIIAASYYFGVVYAQEIILK